jgi:Protein of unknown function (DUF2510)
VGDIGPSSNETAPAQHFVAGWYPDPWNVAPWRWWDGVQWTPGLYGPYGEAWPVANSRPLVPAEPKGPGIKGGGVAAVGALLGAVASVLVTFVYFGIYGFGFVAGDHPGISLSASSHCGRVSSVRSCTRPASMGRTVLWVTTASHGQLPRTWFAAWRPDFWVACGPSFSCS